MNRQIDDALALVRRHLADDLLAVHLYGSAVAGGLKPGSDIDLLVDHGRFLLSVILMSGGMIGTIARKG